MLFYMNSVEGFCFRDSAPDHRAHLGTAGNGSRSVTQLMRKTWKSVKGFQR